jgi:two-component system cell cycle sensor histidine kinase/response regulator CckA
MNAALKTFLRQNSDISLKTGEKLSDVLEEISRDRLREALDSPVVLANSFEMKFLSGVICLCFMKKRQDQSFIIHLLNISETKKIETLFIQAQKTQSIGQLAGGLVHDFNNILTAILGFNDLLLQRVMPNDPSFADLMHIKQNTNRAANLVRQLLSFSRRQSLQTQKVNIAEALSDLAVLLRRLMGNSFQLNLVNERDLWPVKMDVGQLEQVIINLTLNARDAMKDSGKITIETSNYSNERPKNIGKDVLGFGDYVLLRFADTGSGIAPEHLSSIFEPFFSTKEEGKGTGLGLATVSSIIHQAGGCIQVESQVGQGTTFSLFLPRCWDKTETFKTARNLVQDMTGNENILLVEDEEAVRLFASRALRSKGYRVTEAANGGEALKLIETIEPPHLLITDVSMPTIDGFALSQKVQSFFPDIKILFVSGYEESSFSEKWPTNGRSHFLTKPFSLRDLSAKVRDILD